MENFISLDSELLDKAYYSELRPNEICWKPKDIKAAIRALSDKRIEIGAITIYFKVGNQVYCPIWGDCLMLEGNENYLNLFYEINLNQAVDLEMIFKLIKKFALIIDEDYDWSKDKAQLKTGVPKELSNINLNEMYFALSV